MELEFSHHTLYAMGAAIILMLLACLGRAVTPIDGDGRPVLAT